MTLRHQGAARRIEQGLARSASPCSFSAMSILARLRLVCLFAIVLAWCGAAQAQGWVRFTPVGGNYSIDMPGTPKEVRQTTTIAGQPAELHQYAVEVGDSEGFITTFSDVRAGLSRQPADLMLDIQNGVLASFKGSKLRSEKTLQFGKYPGRSFSLQTAEGVVYNQQIAVVGNRIYQNIAVTKSGPAGDGRVRYFFDSFRLLKQ